MSDEVKPRIWVGEGFLGRNWIWTGVWERFIDYELGTGNVFVPGNCPEPTIDPSKMKTIETCGKVD